MKNELLISLMVVFAIGCGKKDGDKDAGPRNNDLQTLALALPGSYQQVPPGIARLIISSENVIEGTTLEIPGPEGDNNRFTPQFPQALTYDAAKGYFKTIGTYNDSTGVFKNVEIRLKLDDNSRFLDVTLVTPPDEALSLLTTTTPSSTTTPAQTTTPVTTNDHKHGGTLPTQTPSQTNPTQQGPTPPCNCPDTQLFYVYRFERIAQ